MEVAQAEGDELAGLRVVLGRQAIVDERRRVAGYEVLYRSSATAQEAGPLDDMAATATVVLAAVAEMGMSSVVGQRDMFVNCSAEVLDLELERLLPPDRVVLEILETVEVSDRLCERIRELRSCGFRVALDDYVVDDGRQVLLPLVDVVKVDLPSVAGQLDAVVAGELSDFCGLMLAEKVETEAEFQRCVALGFRLFQGFFFCRPNTLAQNAPQQDRTQLFRIVSEVQRSDITIDEAAELVRTDVALTYRLLNCLNSVVFGVRQPVESLRQALVLLGMPRVRAWISLMALSQVKGKSQEVVRIALVRASMAQRLAERYGAGDPDVLFTIGLLSVLDGLLDMDMADVLLRLPLADPIKGALLGGGESEGVVLRSVLAYERGDFADALSAGSGVSLDGLGEAWLAAVGWADETASALLGD